GPSAARGAKRPGGGPWGASRTLIAPCFTAVCPIVTCPSAASASCPLRSTPSTVVERAAELTSGSSSHGAWKRLSAAWLAPRDLLAPEATGRVDCGHGGGRSPS